MSETNAEDSPQEAGRAPSEQIQAAKFIPKTDEEILAVHVGGPPLTVPVRVVDYDPAWPRLFQREAERVKAALGDRIVSLEHVGSTSVPGLAAKPRIDMLLVVANSADESAYVPALEAVGYVLRIREPDWYEHRMFNGPDTTVNLHVFSPGCPEIERMLLFRDWLRGNASDRQLYERTKRELARRNWKYTQNYADAKTAVVEEILARARGEKWEELMTDLSYNNLREQMVQAARRLAEAGVLSHSGHGNISVRLPEKEQLLLTSVSHIAHLTTEQLVVVTFDGEVVEGNLDPTSREIVGMHACVYRERRDVQAVIHTHSPRVTSFALAQQPLPCVYEAFLRFGITEAIPVADWAPRGSAEAVSYIVEQLRQHPSVPAVLLANHGLLAFDRDVLATAQLIIIMEEAAQLTLDARMIGGEKPFPAGALERERKHMKQFGSL